MNIECLDPELAVRQTAKPQVYQAKTLDQIALAWELAKECLDSHTPWSICIATASPEELKRQDIIAEKPKDFEAQARPLGDDYLECKDSVSVAAISDVKGFEFSLIIIVGCSEKELPRPGTCSGEAWRDALRLYVAMTRARDQVYLLYDKKPSHLLECMREKVVWLEK